MFYLRRVIPTEGFSRYIWRSSTKIRGHAKIIIVVISQLVTTMVLPEENTMLIIVL